MDSRHSMVFAALATIWSLGGDLPSQTSRPGEAGLAIHEQDFAAWRQWLRPGAEETVWATSVPWVASFAEGIRRADEQAKPLLLWVMNGHPLGCT